MLSIPNNVTSNEVQEKLCQQAFNYIGLKQTIYAKFPKPQNFDDDKR